MGVRVQIILEKKDAARFREQARHESKSLSAWLREAGRKAMEEKSDKKSLRQPKALKAFFRECNRMEKGAESEWDEMKAMIEEGFRGANL